MREFIRITDKTLHWFQPLLEEPLIRRLANPESGTYAIGAVEDKTACGVLVFRTGDPAAEILTLAVSPQYRRRGIARGMVEYLCRHAWATVTPVVCSFAAPDRQDPVYLFFAHLESFSVAPEEGLVCRVPLSELPRRKLAAMGEKRGKFAPSIPCLRSYDASISTDSGGSMRCCGMTWTREAAASPCACAPWTAPIFRRWCSWRRTDRIWSCTLPGVRRVIPAS